MKQTSRHVDYCIFQIVASGALNGRHLPRTRPIVATYPFTCAHVRGAMDQVTPVDDFG